MSIIKKKAIDHYDRMIGWAAEQDPDESISGERGFVGMRISLGEVWEAQDCIYCVTFRCCNRTDIITQKTPCPLYKKYFGCCAGLWSKLNNSKTWAEWIENAKVVKQYIKENG